MAVKTCVLVKTTGNEKLTGGKRVVTAQEIYKVLCTSRDDSWATVLQYPALPALASRCSNFLGALCVSRDPQRQANAEEWLVTIDYTSHPDIGKADDPDQITENPLLRRAVIDRNPQTRQRVITTDAYGQVYQTTAGEYPDPPEEIEEHAPAFTIQKNLAAWPSTLELAFTDAINLSAVSYPGRGIVYPAKAMKFNGFAGGEKWENGYKFVTVTAGFEVNWQGWNQPKVNAGYHEIWTHPDTGEEFLFPIIGANGERPSKPVLIDENGKADPFRATPVLIDRRKHRELEFGPLMAIFNLS